MIDISKLTKKDIGRKVVFSSFNGTRVGILTGWDQKFVNVDFSKVMNSKYYVSKGCPVNPSKLSFKKK